MEIWSGMSKGLKWTVSVATTIVALGGAFAVLGGGTEAVDEMFTSEAEHDHDIQGILQRMRIDGVEHAAAKQLDLKNRYIREWDRLDRDLKGGNYSNEDEKASMLRSLKRNQDGIDAANNELLRLMNKLEKIKDA